MKVQNLFALLLFVIMGLGVVSCDKDDSGEEQTDYQEEVVIANRASGSVSFIDAETNEVVETLPIVGSEPMYVVYVPSKDKIYVGDRAANKVHIINPETRTVEGTVNVGNGVFHMWADGQGNQLWVNNDVDYTVSVIDLNTNSVNHTIDLGIKPHDVFVDATGNAAFVSVFTETEAADSIYAFSTSTFAKVAAQAVGKDPHLFCLPNMGNLIVPCQSGEVYELNSTDLSLSQVNVLQIEGAHGIYPSPNYSHVFVSNISGGELHSISTSGGINSMSTIEALAATPHNLVVNQAGDKLFVTHSGGTANQVSTYGVNAGTLTQGSLITVENNPFGLAYFKREI